MEKMDFQLCLIKEIQINPEPRKMEEIDLVSKSTVDDLIHQKLEVTLPNVKMMMILS